MILRRIVVISAVLIVIVAGAADAACSYFAANADCVGSAYRVTWNQFANPTCCVTVSIAQRPCGSETWSSVVSNLPCAAGAEGFLVTEGHVDGLEFRVRKTWPDGSTSNAITPLCTRCPE